MDCWYSLSYTITPYLHIKIHVFYALCIYLFVSGNVDSVYVNSAWAFLGFRIVHSALPSRPFRRTLESYPRLTGGALELQVCPRSHMKIVIVDGAFAYCGSANFTGAGLGVKSEHKRNLEVGVVSSDPAWVAELEALFDRFWIGDHCDDCRLRDECPDPVR